MTQFKQQGIPQQVRLHPRVAFSVVMQGIRIRFGRSLITVMGVVLGIAFLMSILTGQALKKGVSDEDRLRTEVGRMLSFFTSEAGSPNGKKIGVLYLGGSLKDEELRLLGRLKKEGAESFIGYAVEGDPSQLKIQEVEMVGLKEWAHAETSATVVLGNGAFPSIEQLALDAQGKPKVFAVTQASLPQANLPNVRMISLVQEYRPEEIQKMEDEKKQATFRNNWIIAISLLVTVIGISNAMLMSVTERFREIGTMKCLGALSSFVRMMFLIESALMGVVGGVVGAVVGLIFSCIVYAFTYGIGLTWMSIEAVIPTLAVSSLMAVVAGVVLSIVAALYPANFASRMVPATALRTSV